MSLKDKKPTSSQNFLKRGETRNVEVEKYTAPGVAIWFLFWVLCKLPDATAHLSSFRSLDTVKIQSLIDAQALSFFFQKIEKRFQMQGFMGKTSKKIQFRT